MSHDTCEKVQEKRKSFLSTFGAHILQIKSHVYFIKFIDDENGLDYSQNSENNEQFLKLIKKQKKKKQLLQMNKSLITLGEVNYMTQCPFGLVKNQVFQRRKKQTALDEEKI